MKSDSSPDRDHAPDDDVTKEPDATDGGKKRKRKPYRPGEITCRLYFCLFLSSLLVTFISLSLCVPGIGGFMVRQRGAKAGPGRIKLCRKDLTEKLLGQDEGEISLTCTC